MLAVYRALFLAQLQAASQYRIQMFLWMLFSIIRPVIFLAAWVAVTHAQGGDVAGFTVADFAAYYVILTLVIHLTTSWNAYDFEFEVRLGRLSPKLLRPLHPVHYAIVENLVWKTVTMLGLLPVLVALSLTFGARFETELTHVALFIPSIILAAWLRFMFVWVLACLAFWTTRAAGAANLFDRGAFIFSGQIAPLALMPGILHAISYALPFAYMLGVPADILRGAESVDRALVLIGGQALWLLAAMAGFRLMWRAGLRQYTAVGA